LRKVTPSNPRSRAKKQIPASSFNTRIKSPDWHAVTLRETEQLVREGKAEFSDWQTARCRVRRKAARMA
ncbi:MAG TPA: hypothetical protein VIL39_02505, partial [Verrucomicrobiae bacterium]